MVIVQDSKGKDRYSIDNSVARMLNRFKEKVLKEDQEVWVAFGGDTGTGKSLNWVFCQFDFTYTHSDLRVALEMKATHL